jgi:thymidylate kinase
MLFTIEGIDGVGKSTTIEYLKKLFEGNPDVIFTKEPQYLTIEEKHALVRIEDPLERLAIFFKDHTKHMREVIEPNYDDKIIICDRYIHSRVAYQSLELSRVFDMPVDDMIDYVEGMHYLSYWPDKVFFIWSDYGMLYHRLKLHHDGMTEDDIIKLLSAEEVYLYMMKRGSVNTVPYVGLEMVHGSEYNAAQIYENILMCWDTENQKCPKCGARDFIATDCLIKDSPMIKCRSCGYIP